MKKLIAIVLVIVYAFLMTTPALADGNGNGKGTVVEIQAGGSGTAPLVKAKWETSGSITDETGDPGHAIAGTQLLPILGFQNTAPVRFYAIISWGSNNMNLGKVYADVYYPADCTTDPGAPNSLKFEIPLTLIGTSTSALPTWNAALAVGPQPIITINANTPKWPAGTGTQAADITEELTESQAYLYYADYYFDNCELAGDYTVIIHANTMVTNLDGSLTNTVTWKALTGADFDFGSVNYSAAGPVAVGAHVVIGGDKVWDTPTTGAAPNPNPPTIRNIGNTYLQMLVKEDDMGLGMTGNNWNVHFDARLGNSAPYTNFDPVAVKGGNLSGAAFKVVGDVNSTQILRLCALEKIDFSITIDKDPVEQPVDTHSYQGTLVLGSQSATATPDVGTEYGFTTLPPIGPIPYPTTNHITSPG